MNVAIYSRQSKISESGDSIENQIFLCKEYARNHLQCTDENIFIFEDEGFSGGNANRPAFQTMLKAAKKKKFQALICYRLDRVSRNISDFTSLMTTLEQDQIAFISIREQFDTTTPMGKAMMYIASVFAQLERDTIAERIRDNFKQLALTGRYLGGGLPLGFINHRIDATDHNGNKKKMSIFIEEPKELDTVQRLFQKYLELDSLKKLLLYTHENFIFSKNNLPFNVNALKYILTNPVYVCSDTAVYDYYDNDDYFIACERSDMNGNGLMRSRMETKNRENTPSWVIALGKHKGIIDSTTWLMVQKKLFHNKFKAFRKVRSTTALLSGILKCHHCGSYMRPRTSRPDKDGNHVFYYMCETKELSKKKKCTVKNIHGTQLDARIMQQITALFHKNIPSMATQLTASHLLAQWCVNDLHELASIQKNIAATKIAIENLLTSLQKENAKDTNQLILDRIEKLQEENKNRLQQQTALEKARTNKTTQQKMEFLHDTLDTPERILSDCDVTTKRLFIKKVYAEMRWDGNTITCMYAPL